MVFSKFQSPTENLLKMGGASFLIHVVLVVFFSLNPWPSLMRTKPNPTIVTLMTIPLQDPEMIKSEPPVLPKEETPRPIEKMSPIQKPKKDDIVEKQKKPSPQEKVSLNRLQEAIEEIRKKAALDEIKKRIARRERSEERPMVASSPVPVTSTLQKPSELESQLSKYYSLIWAKIKGSWTIPENLLKEKVDLETVIVLIIEKDGRIQKVWFEKKSGNELYDQMAMRAIKKAEPLPPIPNELNENTLEFGIRFFPD
jgi:TonB family protein